MGNAAAKSCSHDCLVDSIHVEECVVTRAERPEDVLTGGPDVSHDDDGQWDSESFVDSIHPVCSEDDTEEDLPLEGKSDHQPAKQVALTKQVLALRGAIARSHHGQSTSAKPAAKPTAPTPLFSRKIVGSASTAFKEACAERAAAMKKALALVARTKTVVPFHADANALLHSGKRAPSLKHVVPHSPKPCPGKHRSGAVRTGNNAKHLPSVLYKKTPILNLLGTTLLTKDGVRDTSDVLAGKRVILLYFGAAWDKSCKLFDRVMATSYKQYPHEDLEIVYVSSDRGIAAFKNFYGQMPWAALPFDDLTTLVKLHKLFAVKSFPALVVLEEDGRLVTPNGRQDIMSCVELTAALELWGIPCAP